MSRSVHSLALRLILHSCVQKKISHTHTQLHLYNYTHTITLTQLHSYNYTYTITLTQLHLYNYTHTITLIQFTRIKDKFAFNKKPSNCITLEANVLVLPFLHMQVTFYNS